ncbi:MAG: mannose-1-phosphate guanylyltransferase [Corynebacteriales bacterium]|nr:mannose-1-phosphate guanylyltransferase [Mycobacteriales bacterium]
MGSFYAVVPAGGSGTRLWPLSRRTSPKFLHPLAGGERSLLQATIDRLSHLADAEHTLVVTGARHAASVARQLPELAEDHIVIEPAPRDSAPAIGLAAALIARRDPEAVMGSFAADHRVTKTEAFIDAVLTAIDVARNGYLVTIGLTPTRPETGYGYIHQAEPLPGSGFTVAEFKEKPSLAVAEQYVASGDYLWNASMFVWQVRSVLAELERQSPALYAGVQRIAQAWDTSERDAVLADVWPSLPRISIDYAVMEGAATAGRVATVPADIGWNDVGDWDTLGEILPSDAAGNTIIGRGQVQLTDAHDCVVVPHDRLVALLGLRNVIVVDTPDAMLVADRSRAQDVKKIVDTLNSDSLR